MEQIVTDGYIRYKSGFYEGKGEFLARYVEDNSMLNVIPTMDKDDLFSIGYHDGYCYFLKKFVAGESIDTILTNEKLEESAKKCYADAIIKYNQFNNKSEPVSKFRI